MVEQKPSKLTTRVRFPSPAPVTAVFASRWEHGSKWLAVMCESVESVVLRGMRPCSSVAEHSLGKGEVACSIHAMGTSFR